MSLPLRLLPEAKVEFVAAADWYEEQRAGLGTTFLTRVREVFRRIAANPRLHAPVYQDVRKAVVKQFPFVVLYREENGANKGDATRYIKSAISKALCFLLDFPCRGSNARLLSEHAPHSPNCY